MAKEKIKVSAIIDKEAVKNLAFAVAEPPEEYSEVEDVINDTEELVRDFTEEKSEKIAKSGNDVFGRLALDILLCENKGLLMSKNADNSVEKPDKSGFVVVELTKEQAKEITDKIKSFTNKE